MVHAATATSTPRALRREKTSERILDTAEAILGAEGSSALTMQRLASELGYTVGATYRYYESKEAIVAALQRRVFASLEDDLATRLDARESDPLVRIAILARIYATLGVRRPLHGRLLSRMMGEPENLVDAAHGAHNTEVALRIGGAALRELAAARTSGALGPGDDAQRGLVLWSALTGVTQTRKLERWQVPGLRTNALADQLLRTLLIGWGADAAKTDDAIARAEARVPSQPENDTSEKNEETKR